MKKRVFKISFLAICFFAFFSCTTHENVLYAELTNAKGINAKTKVTMHGVEIAQVSDVDVTKDGALVKIKFKKKYELPIDSEFNVVTANFFGNKSIVIEQGTSTEILAYGDTIQLDKGVVSNLLDGFPIDIENAIQSFIGDTNMDSIMNAINDVFKDLDADSLQMEIDKVMEELKELNQ